MAKETLPADLFSQSGQAAGRQIYTVSALTRDIKGMLENTFSGVWVEGEVSNFRPSPAGHCYFSLKDEGALLPAVVFNRLAREIKFKLEDGLKVVCFGNVEVYPPHGKYQLVVERAEPKGLGSLQLALEQLKQKLEKEGLFSPEHKRPLPYLPERIGVVTSLQGAAIKDILKVLDRRFRDTHIIIAPVRVQGEGAKEEIAQAIADFNAFNQGVAAGQRVEVLIVGRGGGSIEDLWAFNEEVVARAIYNSKIPVISAVGHERDVTIADLVADLRAATPSVAAEIAIPRKEELQSRLEELEQDLKRGLQEAVLALQEANEGLEHRLALGIDHALELYAGELDSAHKKLLLLNPLAGLKRYQERISDLQRQAGLRAINFLKLKQMDLAKATEKLSGLSPLNILGRGYSITFLLPEGKVVKEASALRAGDLLKTKMHQGEVISQVKEAG